jgi:NADPH-dependent 2,4-dienoyl-CoA reductase/sulfur reductase-like enzyme
VLVAGGGPAGLKAAAVAARRGHDVTLLERSDELGGHVALLARLPGRAAWGEGIASWESDARRAGVDIRLGEEADAATVAREGAEVVLVATGATWDTDGIGAARPDVRARVDAGLALDVAAAARRALEDPTALGRHVVIVDESGEHLPLGLASLLAGAGVRVEVVSRHPVVGEYVVRALDGPHVHARLAAGEVELMPGFLFDGFDGERVALTQAWSKRARTLDAVDTLVLSMLRSPANALVSELAGADVEARAIGDALVPRRTDEVIHEGERVGRAL